MENQILVATNPEDRVKELHNFVFRIPLLRETILNYVIHDGRNVSRANAYTSRLVCRSWLESVNKCLIGSGTTLFHISLGIRDYVSSKDSTLNQFINAYSSPSRLLNSVPPFELCLYFHETTDYTKSNKVLEKCLLGCSSGLVALHLGFYDSCSIFPYTIPDSASFPVLKNMYIRFHFRPERNKKIKVWRSNVTSKIQMLLSRCKKLTCLYMQEQDTGLGDIVADAFKTLRLPATLTKLKLGGKLVNAYTEQLLTYNASLQLTALSISIPRFLPDDTIYRIATLFSNSLRYLSISGDRPPDEDEQKTRIHFPTMKRLASLYIALCNWKWGEGVADLGKCLPVAKKMNISLLTPFNLSRLVHKNQFETTEELSIILTGNEALDFVENWKTSLRQFPVAFRNLSVLEIKATVANDAPHIFQPVFENVRGIKKIRLHIEEDCNSLITNQSHFWSLLFLGTLPEEIPAENVPHVTKLTELCVLDVHYTPCDKDSDSEEEEEEETPARDTTGKIPDVVFEYGFLRMPNLFNVNLEGNILVSEDIARKWEDAGRRLTLSSRNSYA